MEKPRDRAALAQDYTDPAWKIKFLELLSVTEILTHCVIKSSFKVSDDLNKAIALSDAGKKVRDQLITKEQVEAKDANLLCLLGLVHVEPLIDIDNIDVDRLVEAISPYVIDGRIKFPLVFGRELYDGATSLIPEERRVLKHEDTVRLLEDKNQGVFHTGPFLLGPYGIHRVSHRREIAPRYSTPLQHCADLSCPSVHSVRLTTSYEAPINKSRPALSKVLDQISKDPADWNGFVLDLVEPDYNPYRVDDLSTLPFLLGDAFSDAELRSILKHAVEAGTSSIVKNARRLGLSGDVAIQLPRLERAHLLQILLTLPDAEIGNLIDDCISEGDVHIPTGEVRRPVVNHRKISGAWRLHPEVSSLGYRVRPESSSTTLLRLFSLVRSLFDSQSAEDMDDLAWLLREFPGTTAAEKLEAFLRASEPRDIVSTLILGRRKNAESVSKSLHIDISTDSDFLDAVLWKLGFSLTRSSDVRDEYWRHHQQLETFVTTASANADSTEERLRSIASNYFVALERFLFDSLTFATWALLTDHVAAKRPFEYFLGPARDFTIATLNNSTDRGVGNERNDLQTDPDLSSIVQGFLRLADHLESLAANEQSFERSQEAFPRYNDQTDLQKFPFVHTVPFLDLLASCQHALPETLRTVGKQLNESGIMTARNGLFHAKSKRTPSIAEVNESLSQARSALRLLEESGCVRNTFEVVSSNTDAWGRSITLMRSHGAEIRFSGPSGYRMLGLPALNRPVYLMQGALFANPNQMLRFKEGFESEYSTYWEGIPHRPQRGSAVSLTEPGRTLEEHSSPASVA